MEDVNYHEVAAELVQHVRRGEVRAVTEALHQHAANVNQVVTEVDGEGWSPFTVAADQGNLEVST